MTNTQKKVSALNTLHKSEELDLERTIHDEIVCMERILLNYMKREDAVKFTFHMLNILRAFKIGE